jgi:hypothetical protein
MLRSSSFTEIWFEIHVKPKLTWSKLFSTQFSEDSQYAILSKSVKKSSRWNMRTKLKKKLTHGLSPHANYTDRVSDRRLSAKLVPTLADRGCCVVSATIPPVVNFRFSRLEPLFPRKSSSIIITRLSGPRSSPTTSQKKIWESNPDLWICGQELWPLDHRGGPMRTSEPNKIIHKPRTVQWNCHVGDL